jgi:hypothetical protein
VGVNIAGNTCSWSRIPSVLSSRSVLFDAYQRDICWWHPVMMDGVHYISVELPSQSNNGGNLLQKFTEVVNNKERCSAIADAANSLASNYTRAIHAAQYTKHLLESSEHHHAA